MLSAQLRWLHPYNLQYVIYLSVCLSVYMHMVKCRYKAVVYDMYIMKYHYTHRWSISWNTIHLYYDIPSVWDLRFPQRWVKNSAFGIVSPCSLYWCFWVTCCLHIQSRAVKYKNYNKMLCINNSLSLSFFLCLMKGKKV